MIFFKQRIRIFYLLLFLLCYSGLSHAGATGMYLDSSNGLKLVSRENKNYWCKLSLLVKVDCYSFSERNSETQALRIYGNRVRLAELCINGSVNDHWSYLFKLDWKTFYAKYSGISKNTLLYFGQVVIPFGLENACSSKWSPFLERSLPTYTFSPGYGIGASFRQVFYDSTISGSLTTSAYGQRNRTQNQPLQKTLRITYAPIHEPCQVLHFGISARYQRLLIRDRLRFLSRPEIRLRNDTGFSSAHFHGLNYCACLGLEFATMLGPFCFQTEITKGLVNPRAFTSNLKQCSGGYIQTSYILTGEPREYDFKSGTFGRIRPASSIGAFDIAFRYSYLNLESPNRKGSIEWSNTFALGWTINNHVRLFGNYIIAKTHRRNAQDKRLDIFGLRLQWLY